MAQKPTDFANMPALLGTGKQSKTTCPRKSGARVQQLGALCHRFFFGWEGSAKIIYSKLFTGGPSLKSTRSFVWTAYRPHFRLVVWIARGFEPLALVPINPPSGGTLMICAIAGFLFWTGFWPMKVALSILCKSHVRFDLHFAFAECPASQCARAKALSRRTQRKTWSPLLVWHRFLT